MLDDIFDRNNPVGSVVGIAAYIGAAVGCYRYGASMRQPVVGGLVGALVAGPAAAMLSRWAVGMVTAPNALPQSNLPNNPPANPPANPPRR